MPFQVAYSAKATPTGVIAFFSAGPDQQAVCDGAVTMTAIVIGDTEGHAFLWEQLSGSAVAWTTPLNQFSVSFTTATFDDKVFRFWVDKGAGNQQFDDINIFSTPTFSFSVGGSGADDSFVEVGIGGLSQAPVLKIATAFTESKSSLAECRTATSPQKLLWTVAAQEGRIIQFVVQFRNNAGPWSDEAILPAGSNAYTTLANVGAAYQVVVVREELNSTISSTPSNTVNSDGRISTVRAGVGAEASDWTELGTGGATDDFIEIPTYTVSLLTVTACPPDGPDNAFIGGVAATDDFIEIPTYTVSLLVLRFCNPDGPDNAYIGGNAATDDFIEIPTYTVLDLNGGQIGG